LTTIPFFATSPKIMNRRGIAFRPSVTGIFIAAISAAIFAAALLVPECGSNGWAADPSDREKDGVTDGANRVVARIGDNTITVGELEKRLASLSTADLLAYGQTPDEAKRNYLSRVMIPEILFLQGAIDREMHIDPAMRARQAEQLKRYLLIKLRDETIAASKIGPEEIAAFYADNATKYKSPALVMVWRILVGSRDQAMRIIRELGREPLAKDFDAIAKQHSQDKTTGLRGGNLGYLTEEGVSSDGKTQVSPDLVKAAMTVRDGEIVGQPVPEGSGFAVVWRRGSMPAQSRSLADEAQNIKRTLEEYRVRAAEETLIEKLRNEHASILVPNGTQLIEIKGGGELGQPDKPGRIVRRPGKTTPLPTPRGLR